MPRLSKPSDDPATQAKQVVRSWFSSTPTVECALVHRNPYELLVATILRRNAPTRASQHGHPRACSRASPIPRP